MKPLGVWQAYTDAPHPSWASFAAIPDWDDFDAAAQQSEATGIAWVLLLYGCPLDQPVAGHLASVVTRLDASGLRPHIRAICYWEECYAALKGGRVNLPAWQSVTTDLRALVPLFRDHLSRQHAAIRAALPEIPICWVTDYVNHDPSFGPWYHQPLPAHVGLVALQGYLPASGSWAADVEPFLQHSLTQTALPIVFVPQGFTAPNDPQWSRGPTTESIDAIARWMRHPRVVAGWLFDWASPPPSHGVVGLEDLSCRDQMLAALGV
jgi:hypothetical protein